ncbi:rhomboid-like protein [Streptomyces sp. NBC_01465]|uniref:rhomboid-like protein n=1 Tax=Streptomyces sp. NBC_01465 TaxID=2903878 RepID=UPI002E370623|nr:rhomboid-like protein [Streptomyces sp. NBC_01465]
MSHPVSDPGSRHHAGTVAARALHAVWSYIRSAPGTYIWLAVLFVTTVAMRHMSPEFLDEFLGKRSTNIHNLTHHPFRVLFQSAMWIDGSSWLPYAVLYTIFHAQAERWLGTWRWIAVLAAAHILASYISEGALLWAIHHGHASESMVNTLDVGVSYALAGVVAVLTYRIATPWRYVYLIGVLVIYGAPVITGRTFTDLGHFTSVLIGLACYPITRGRGPAWNPMSLFSRDRQPSDTR